MLTNKFFKTSLLIGTLVATTSSFAFGFGSGSFRVWGGAGYGHNDIAKPLISTIVLAKKKLAWGGGASYLMSVNPNFSVGAGVSYLKSPDSTLTYTNLRYTYSGYTIPVEAIGAFSINKQFSVEGDLGVAHVNQKLAVAVIKSIPGSVVDVTGTTSGWKPIAGIGLAYHVSPQFDIGVHYRYLFGSAPKAFQSNTTSQTGQDTSLYRKIASQGYLLVTAGVSFG